MAISKVVYGSNVLIDLTADTIEADKLLKGITAHGPDGEPITGSCEYDANTQDATATAAEILSGKIAYNKGNRLQGTMTNNGSVAGTISTKTGEYSIPKGYHDGSGKVAIDATEQSKLVSSNIRDGVTILGVTGTMSGTEGAKAQSKTVTPSATGPVTVTPDEGYNYLSQVTVEKISYQESNNSAGGITVTIA